MEWESTWTASGVLEYKENTEKNEMHTGQEKKRTTRAGSNPHSSDLHLPAPRAFCCTSNLWIISLSSQSGCVYPCSLSRSCGDASSSSWRCSRPSSDSHSPVSTSSTQSMAGRSAGSALLAQVRHQETKEHGWERKKEGPEAALHGHHVLSRHVIARVALEQRVRGSRLDSQDDPRQVIG